jgi:hypothetical protein
MYDIESDDEFTISMRFSNATKRHSAAVGSAVMVHLAYFPQVRTKRTKRNA